MCTKSKLREYENEEKEIGNKMVKFHGKNKLELGNKLWKFVNKNHIDIKFLICRKFRYNLYY